MKRRKDREMERQIRSILNQAEMEEGDWGRPEEGRKQETLTFLRAQRRKIRLRPRKSFAERLLDQASWLSPGVWLGQLAVPVLFCLEMRDLKSGIPFWFFRPARRFPASSAL